MTFIIIVAILAVVIIAVARSRSQVVLTWKSTVFRRGDRVRIRMWAGTKKPEDTGHPKEVDSGPGQTGTVVKKINKNAGSYTQNQRQLLTAIGEDTKKPRTPNWLLLVRFDEQEWREDNSGGKRVRLPQFDSTIHPDYLEHFDSQPLPPQKLEAEGKTFIEGQRVRFNKRTHFSPDDCPHPQGVYGRVGQTGVFFRGSRNGGSAVVDWSAQEWEEDETKKIVRLPAFTSNVNPSALDICS